MWCVFISTSLYKTIGETRHCSFYLYVASQGNSQVGHIRLTSTKYIQVKASHSLSPVGFYIEVVLQCRQSLQSYFHFNSSFPVALNFLKFFLAEISYDWSQLQTIFLSLKKIGLASLELLFKQLCRKKFKFHKK